MIPLPTLWLSMLVAAAMLTAMCASTAVEEHLKAPCSASPPQPSLSASASLSVSVHEGRSLALPSVAVLLELEAWDAKSDSSSDNINTNSSSSSSGAAHTHLTRTRTNSRTQLRTDRDGRAHSAQHFDAAEPVRALRIHVRINEPLLPHYRAELSSARRTVQARAGQCSVVGSRTPLSCAWRPPPRAQRSAAQH